MSIRMLACFRSRCSHPFAWAAANPTQSSYALSTTLSVNIITDFDYLDCSALEVSQNDTCTLFEFGQH